MGRYALIGRTGEGARAKGRWTSVWVGSSGVWILVSARNRKKMKINKQAEHAMGPTIANTVSRKVIMYPSEGEWGRATVMRELMGIRFGRGVRAQSCISWSDALPSSVVQHQGKALCSQYNYTGVAAGGARKHKKGLGVLICPKG